MTLSRMPTMQQKVIDSLRSLAQRDSRETFSDADERTPPVSTFIARHKETISEQTVPLSGLLIVIEGYKDLLWGTCCRTYSPGEAFLLPAGAFISVVNTPDPRSGLYRGLFIRFSGRLLAEAAARWPHLTHAPLLRDPSVALSPALCSALIHCGEVLSQSIPAPASVIDHRLLEVLLLLAEQKKLSLSLRQADVSLSDSIRLLIRNRPDQPWSSAALAGALSLSEATLRRRLNDEKTTLRAVVTDERMHAARDLLEQRDISISEVIAAVGYTSRWHFARRFEETFGIPPSAARKKSPETEL